MAALAGLLQAVVKASSSSSYLSIASEQPPMAAAEQTDRSRGSAWRRALPALIVCLVAGVLISALPHFLSWMRSGRPVWLADHDDLDVYVLVAGHSYMDDAWRLTDPVLPGGETYLPPVQLVPGVVIAKVAHLDPIYINFIWRI